MKLSLINVGTVVGLLILILGMGYFCLKKKSHSVGQGQTNEVENYLNGYSQKKKHPNFKKVLVVVDGINGIDETVTSILKQNIQVDEIATCHDAKLGRCNRVVNKYKDPWSKGIVKNTWEREFDRGTVAVFLKGGRELPHTRYLSNLLDKWTPEEPLRLGGILVMKSEQFKN